MTNSLSTICQTDQASPITLRTFSSLKQFDETIADFEKQLGKLDQVHALKASNMQTAVKSMEGELGLMIIHVLEMGDLLSSFVESHTRARQYLVGNPIIASLMAKLDPLAALYAPPRVLIYSTDGGTSISYDQPSSVFGRLNGEEILDIARDLDQKFETLVMCALRK